MLTKEDHSLRAALYDATHRGHPGDVEFYRQQCPDQAALLELGCGSGRVLRALLPRQGETAGLDIDASLLSIAREWLDPDVELFCADMLAFRSERRFDRIILPFNGIYCLDGEKSLPALFATVRHHLKDDGEFLLDLYDTDPLEEDAAQVWPEELLEDEEDHILDILVDDETYRVWEQTRWLPRRRRFEVTFTYEPESPLALPIEMEIVHNYFPLQTLLNSARAHALELVDHLQGFPQGDPDGEQPHVLRFRPAGIIF